jgi:hypothetical protein
MRPIFLRGRGPLLDLAGVFMSHWTSGVYDVAGITSYGSITPGFFITG